MMMEELPQAKGFGGGMGGGMGAIGAEERSAMVVRGTVVGGSAGYGGGPGGPGGPQAAERFVMGAQPLGVDIDTHAGFGTEANRLYDFEDGAPADQHAFDHRARLPNKRCKIACGVAALLVVVALPAAILMAGTDVGSSSDALTRHSAAVIGNADATDDAAPPTQSQPIRVPVPATMSSQRVNLVLDVSIDDIDAEAGRSTRSIGGNDNNIIRRFNVVLNTVRNRNLNFPSKIVAVEI